MFLRTGFAIGPREDKPGIRGSDPYTSKVAMEQTIEAVQFQGDNGFVKEYYVERFI